MVQGIRDWAITIEMGLIKIIVPIILNIQPQGTGELEVKSSVSNARVGVFKLCPTPLIYRWGELKIGLYPEAHSGSRTGRQKPARRPTSTNSNVLRKDIKLEKGPQYHNPEPLVRLIGDTNETNVIVDGVSCKGLVDSGAQISTITKSFAKVLGLKNYHLDRLLDTMGTEGTEVPYEGYVEVSLWIPEIRVYNQDLLM